MPDRGPSRLVALCLPAGAAFVQALDGIWGAGHAVLPLDPRLPPAARQRVLEALRPHEVVDEGGHHPLAGGLPVDPELAVVIATSGSGGQPKGVELDHAALEASARATAARIGAAPGDRWLCCLPPHHIAGFQVIARARHSGAGLDVHPGFDPVIFARSDATLTSVVPTMLHRLLDAGADLSRFRRILLGGAAVPPTLLDRARQAGAPVVVTYGMTETCGGCVYDGVPLDGVRVEVGAGGRIRIAGPVLLRGYRGPGRQPPVRTEGGWFETSDLGRLDEAGRLQVLGRADRVIVTGGRNVVAEHVEELLGAHPGVAEAAVLGVEDAEWGQRVVAVVVPADRRDPPTLEALREHVAAHAPAYLAPRQVEVMAALPRLATGKIDHETLRRRYGSE